MKDAIDLLFPNSLRVFVVYLFVFFQIYDSGLRLRHDYFKRTKCEFFWEDNKSGDESSQWECGIGVGL